MNDGIHTHSFSLHTCVCSLNDDDSVFHQWCVVCRLAYLAVSIEANRYPHKSVRDTYWKLVKEQSVEYKEGSSSSSSSSASSSSSSSSTTTTSSTSESSSSTSSSSVGASSSSSSSSSTSTSSTSSSSSNT